MSTQVKRVKIYSKNHTARIRSKSFGAAKFTGTSKREDDQFRISLTTAPEGSALVITNTFAGGSEQVVLNGRQLRTLRRVIDRHFYNI